MTRQVRNSNMISTRIFFFCLSLVSFCVISEQLQVFLCYEGTLFKKINAHCTFCYGYGNENICDLMSVEKASNFIPKVWTSTPETQIIEREVSYFSAWLALLYYSKRPIMALTKVVQDAEQSIFPLLMEPSLSVFKLLWKWP